MVEKDNLLDKIIIKITSWKFPYIFVCWILYKFFLDVGYYKYVGVAHKYLGYKNEFDPFSYMILWLVYILLFPFINRLIERKKISDIFILLLSELYFSPMLTYCSFNNIDYVFKMCSVVFWAVLLVLQTYVPMPEIDIKKDKSNGLIFKLIIPAVVLFIVFFSIKYSGFRLYYGQMGIYEIRALAEETYIPSLLKRIWSLMAIVLSILLAYVIRKRDFIAFCVLGFAGYVVFSFSCQKSLFFLMALTVFGCFCWRKEIEKLIVPAFTAFVGVCAGEVLVLNSDRLSNTFLRRLFFEQNLIAYYCYDYFSKYPIDVYRQRFMRFFHFESAYGIDIDDIIGYGYYPYPNNADSGLLGDAFTNLGIPGVIILPIAIFLCGRIFDVVAQGIETKYLAGICVYYAVAFRESTFSTVLLTHGFIVMCVLLLFFPRGELGRKNKDGNNKKRS